MGLRYWEEVECIMTKQEAREIMKRRRAQTEEAERKRQSRAVEKLLFASRLWKETECFYPFVSYGSEIDTLHMIQTILKREGQEEKQGKRRRLIAVPRVEGREMEFYEITGMRDLVPGYRGIPEPSAACRQVPAEEGLMLLPGLAFDRQKNRAGYGGGYYDRYLARHDSRKLTTVALAFDFQIVEQIETQAFDIRPDYILTQQGIW